MADPEWGYRSGLLGAFGESAMIRPLRRFFDWLTFRDLEQERDLATDEVVSRYARRNTSMQNGWHLDEKGLVRYSRRADKAMLHIKRVIDAADAAAARRSRVHQK